MTHQHSGGVVGLTVRTEEIPMSPNQELDEAGGSYIERRYQLPGGESPGVSGRSLPCNSRRCLTLLPPRSTSRELVLSSLKQEATFLVTAHQCLPCQSGLGTAGHRLWPP